MSKSELLQQIHSSYEFQYQLSQVPGRVVEVLNAYNIAWWVCVVFAVLLLVSIAGEILTSSYCSNWSLGIIIGGFGTLISGAVTCGLRSDYLDLVNTPNLVITKEILTALTK